MQIAAETAMSKSLSGAALFYSSAPVSQPLYSQIEVIRHSDAAVPFEFARMIPVAMTKARPSADDGRCAVSARLREMVAASARSIVGRIVRRRIARDERVVGPIS